MLAKIFIEHLHVAGFQLVLSFGAIVISKSK